MSEVVFLEISQTGSSQFRPPA